ncbi:FG-GAP repeat domain-containing protein [Pseudoalteromonas fenneropenaei]|uniref:FG-GAP repeat domain-containing protein n=1 Tax=Pseudoalteromonas fenneropenaei TaxID=1737459 RepID=A0ABV7CPV6_9GAMM
MGFQSASLPTKLLSLLLLAIVPSCFTPSVAALSYQTLNHQSNYNISRPPIVADVAPLPGKEIILIGSGLNQAHQITILALQNEALSVVDEFAIGKNYFAVDVLESAAEGEVGLFFLARDHVAAYRVPTKAVPDRLSLYSDVHSFYQLGENGFLAEIDFIADLNQDRKADVMLPAMDHFTVWLSGHHELRKHTLPIAAARSLVRNELEVRPPSVFFKTAEKAKVYEVTQGLISQYTLSGGVKSLAIKVADDIHGVNWWDLRDDSGQSPDQSELSHRVVEDILDVNGDAIDDLVVRFTTSSGALDRRNDYEFYYGSLDDKQQLSFSSKPNTTIRAEGTLAGLELIDINQDGKLEVLVSGFEIGVSQIISALLSGSIAQDVLLYWQDDNGEFGKKPANAFDTELRFSLSKGRAGDPLVTLADMDGDKQLDLLLSEGENRISIRPLKAAKQFSAPLKVNAPFPQAGSNIVVADLNADGKAELLMAYDKLDAVSTRKLLRVLVSKD